MQPSPKVVFVTGANRGLGAHIARELAAAGHVVAIGARSSAAAEATRRELLNQGATCSVVVCDVANYEDARRAVGEVVVTHGRIDAIVNNAGVVEPIGRLGDTDPAQWAQLVTVNLVGCYHTIHAALPEFARRGSGTIVNISTGAADQPREGWSGYCSSKAGLAMLTRVLDLEYRASGVKAYSLRPGIIDTDMQGVIRASRINDVSRIPRDKLAPPERPARVTAWLVDAVPDDLVGRELSMADAGLYDRAVAGLKR